MTERKRRIEIFSAGCPACAQSIREIRDAACPACEIEVLDLRESEVARRAGEFDIRSVPAVVIDGVLADCCSGRGTDLEKLQAAGLGRPV